MINLLFLLLIFNSFIDLSNQVGFKDLEPFYCKEIDENLNYFKKEEKFTFIVANDTFHLILKDRQFAFKNFYFGDYDEDEQSDELIVGHPYKDKEKHLYEFVGYDHLGIVNNNGQIYLYYKIDSKSDPDCSNLNYHEGKIISFPDDSCFDVKFFDKNSFGDVRKFKHKFVEDKFEYFIIYSNDKKMVEYTKKFEKKVITVEYKIDYEIKMATISNVNRNDSKIDYFNLYEMDENFTIYINRIKARADDSSLTKAFEYEKRISLNRFNFTNIIGCIDKITELNQIKGILFKDNKFYIISYTKYWIYESDLIKERFNLNYTNSSVNYFKFIHEDDLSTVEYEIRFSKWIKQLDNKIYFIPYKNSIFEIKDSINNILQLKKSNKELLNYCKGSTIRFDSDDYCFESTEYFKTKLFKYNDNKSDYSITKYSIRDLFKHTSYNYTIDDKLLFIFKYTDESIVFLTIKSILQIDINLFIKKEDYLKLKTPADDNEFFFDENCLLRECVSVPKSKATVYQTIPSNPLIIILILFIVTIIFCIYLIIKQNDKRPKK